MQFLSILPVALALAIPFCLLLARFLVTEADPLVTARRATLVTALLSVAFVLVPHPSQTPHIVLLGVLTKAMMLLVALLGFVIATFSESYLRGEPGTARYAKNLLTTLCAVTALVSANNLLVLSFAWTATSLSLHELLTFYPTRREAMSAAWKKFLLSRLADACMFGAIVIIGVTVRDLSLTGLTDYVTRREQLPWALHVAAFCVALAVCLKSAQLPFHGWLMQVMEAPTPVSALLHAGIVNIGGFVLIRLAPMMAKAGPAQLFVLVVGSTTAVLASLVMRTRVSIKVALAWSTCAQMGFMLAECALGYGHVAMVHLLAHSCYKAHAFLRAGSAVGDWNARYLAGGSLPRRFGPWLAGTCCAALLAGAAYLLATRTHGASSGAAIVCLLLGTALAPWLAGSFALERGALRSAIPRIVGVAACYGVAHALAETLRLALASSVADSPHAVGSAIAITAIALLFMLQSWLELRPSSPHVQAFRHYLFAGFYLDALFTRFAHRLWSARRAMHGQAAPLLRTNAAAGGHS